MLVKSVYEEQLDTQISSPTAQSNLMTPFHQECKQEVNSGEAEPEMFWTQGEAKKKLEWGAVWKQRE